METKLDSIKELVGVRADKILLDMQEAVVSSNLNNAQSFKLLTAQDLWTGQTFTLNFFRFLILFENFFILRIILVYGNNKQRECAYFI